MELALRELMSGCGDVSVGDALQGIALAGLGRSGFFSIAALGGEAPLGLFRGLDRPTERLEFSLLKPDPEFDPSPFLSAVITEAEAFGLHTETTENRTEDRLGITLDFAPDRLLKRKIARYGKPMLRISVNTDPPGSAGYEIEGLRLPYPSAVRVLDMPSLFAERICGMICSDGNEKIGWRGLYDFVFFLSKKTEVNMRHLQGLLGTDLTVGEVRGKLRRRFSEIDFESAKKDAAGSVADVRKVEGWTAELFKTATDDVREAN